MPGHISGRMIFSRSIALFVFPFLLAPPGFAQTVGAAHFQLDKRVYLLGEPVFCDFIIRNAGPVAIAFPHRAPVRVLSRELGSEPRFILTSASARLLPDPGPQPCGGREGTVVYGSITLPAGQTSVERWVLNQWGRITAPGHYHVHAERHLPLFAFDAANQDFASQPSAYAVAIDDLSFEVLPTNEKQLEKAYKPLLQILHRPEDPEYADAVIAVTTVPHPFLEPRLVALLGRQSEKRPWVRQQALTGLARLGTARAWNAILRLAMGADSSGGPKGGKVALRSSAILLLAEKGDARFLPRLFQLLKFGPETLQEDILRALGFFHDPRANQVLFDHLHSGEAGLRTSAVLGLKNLNTTDVLPALFAMLNDPDEQVRQVANFALQNLTGQKFTLPPGATRAELDKTQTEWRAWWQAHNATFIPAPQPPCRDW
jgi:HEAT repeat